jgi:HAD superfamily phosphoserine phosphatase-like hydrolase
MKAKLHTKKQKVAVFDIDGTLFRSSLLIEVVDALIQEGVFPMAAQQEYDKAFQAWLDRKGSYEDYIHDVVRVFSKYAKGVPYAEFLRVAERTALIYQNRLYRFTRDLVRDLKKKNYYLLAISHSPKTILDGFCKELGFDKVYGHIYESDVNEVMTGKKMYDELMSDKGKVLERAIEKENLTLTGSVGVGDSESDIAFLKMVDRPICFNPNQKLYAYAKRVGWKIVVERKDVVYIL